MKFFRIFSALLTSSLILIACGDDEIGGDRANREFNQDVRLISYKLKNVEVEATIISKDGSQEQLSKKIAYNAEESKDKIQRKIENDKFILVVNEKSAGLSLSSSGKTESSQNTNAQVKTCELNGKSTISGTAENTQLQMNWQLDTTLSGPACEDEMRNKFQAFNSQEIDRLNLQAIRDVMASTDIQKEKTNRVILRMKLTAEGF